MKITIFFFFLSSNPICNNFKHYVTGSNGNSGAGGPFVQGGVGVNEGAIAVGSFDNLATPNPVIKVNGQGFPLSYGTNNAFARGDNTFDYVITDPDAEATQSNTDGCTGSFKVSPRGKVAVIRFGLGGTAGYCGSAVRCNLAAAQGATACILYAPNEASINIAGSNSIPSAIISSAAGQAIVSAFKAGTPAVVQFNPAIQAAFPLATAGTVSDFSSPGLDPELNIKPDIGGIGGQVLSTVSPFVTKANPPYGLLSGTSMSAPYVCGTMALLLESRNKQIDFKEVKSRLVNNANPAKIYKSDLIDSVAKQGGGLVDIYDAITAKTVVYPSSLSLNDTAFTQQHYTINITHTYNVPVRYTLASYGAAQMNPYNKGDDIMAEAIRLRYTPEYASVLFGNKQTTRSFTVQPGRFSLANIDFAPPATADSTLYPIFSGYITLSNNLDDTVISIPYAGMAGAWADAPHWSRNSPTLNEALAVDPVFSRLGFRRNSTGAVGAYVYQSWEPVKEGMAFNLNRDVMMLHIREYLFVSFNLFFNLIYFYFFTNPYFLPRSVPFC
jgi:hypothetical protein